MKWWGWVNVGVTSSAAEMRRDHAVGKSAPVLASLGWAAGQINGGLKFFIIRSLTTLPTGAWAWSDGEINQEWVWPLGVQSP